MALFLDLPAITQNKELISDKFEAGKWMGMSYETALGCGKFLIAPESVNPENIVMNTNLEGWHRIYLCVVNFGHHVYTHVKLTDDLCFTGLKNTPAGSPGPWAAYEYMQECYWKSADLTGQQIILKKPETRTAYMSSLVWIRCEKMSDEEVEIYNSEPVRCVQGHIDVDPYVEEKFETIDDTLMKMHVLKNSNIDFCTIETFVEGDHLRKNEFIAVNDVFPEKWQRCEFDKEELYKRHIEYGHEAGMKIYAGVRMSAGNFSVPTVPSYYNKNFFADNKHLYCKNRDGRTINVCSYAYPETREYMIEHLLENLKYGFDGLSLIYMRGIHIGFEQPVLDRFEELYPGVNSLVLPFSDERLHGVWCEFMTVFMKELRSRVGKNIKINVLTDYGLDTSKHLGLDVEAWASQGLIDSASQADMEIYEDLSGCLSDDGTIDMDKYIEKSLRTEIVKRNYGTNTEKTCSHVKEYLDLEKYGIDVYNILPWVHSCKIDEYKEKVNKLKEAGAKKFLAWNTNHMVWNLPEYNTMRSINNEKYEVSDVLTYYRTLSINDADISSFNPSWKG